MDERYLDVAGRKTHLFVGGDGPPVLYLHSALGEALWADWCEELAAEHTLVLPELPGFGESEGLEDIDDIEDAAFHVDDLITALGLVRPAIVGQSLGGWIGAEHAVRWPERVSRLVLVDAAGLRIADAPVPDMWAHRPPELAELMFADHDHPLYQMMKAFEPDRPPPPDVMVPFFKAQQATARLSWNPYLHDPKLEGRLGRIACPTLVLWGARDRFIPRAHGERYAALIPDASLELVAECGHLPLVERPRETVALIRRFLASS